ncbi:uncharacterized protein VTP21DRAFT_694 [Calcarisporiella thermophila]|uniref:uncharacterized protein n=1 Tax=Calcarisporiella thermophila TaxID=911321 RepID=UPI003743DC64
MAGRSQHRPYFLYHAPLRMRSPHWPALCRPNSSFVGPSGATKASHRCRPGVATQDPASATAEICAGMSKPTAGRLRLKVGARAVASSSIARAHHAVVANLLPLPARVGERLDAAGEGKAAAGLPVPAAGPKHKLGISFDHGTLSIAASLLRNPPAPPCLHRPSSVLLKRDRFQTLLPFRAQSHRPKRQAWAGRVELQCRGPAPPSGDFSMERCKASLTVPANQLGPNRDLISVKKETRRSLSEVQAPNGTTNFPPKLPSRLLAGLEGSKLAYGLQLRIQDYPS